MAKLKEEARRFLAENPFVGTVTTLRPDGSPHSTIVWVDVEDGKVSFNTARGRAKPTYLEQDPRASLLVVDPNDPYKWVSVSGPGDRSADYPVTRAGIEERRPYTGFRGEADADPSEVGLLKELGYDSLLMVAIEGEAGAWGLVEVYREQGRRFEDEDMRLAQRLAGD